MDTQDNDFDILFEKVSKPLHSFVAGDKVKLDQASLKHARSVPAHLGYTTAEFTYRDTLAKYENAVGTIERVFPNNINVNVEFDDGHIIDVPASSLKRAE